MKLRYMFLLFFVINDGLSYASDSTNGGIGKFSSREYNIQHIIRIYDLLEKDKSYREDSETFKLVSSLAFTKEGSMRNFTQFSAQIGAAIGKSIK